MKIVNKLRKVLSLLVAFSLIFQQAGFAQGLAQLDISRYLGNFSSTPLFRPVLLRYFSYNPLDDSFQLLLDKGTLKGIKTEEVKEQGKELLKYFLVGVALPDENFWVNLRPDSEDEIISEKLAETDLGMVLLDADLKLKKDVARFTSPETKEGRDYWDKLYKKAGELFIGENITIPTLTRPWIVPGEVIIRENGTSAYVYKATLKVMLESDYLNATNATNAINATNYSFKDPRLIELNEYSSQLIRELIIPKLTKEVNSSERYAALRQVFFSLILSRWFKNKFAGTVSSSSLRGAAGTTSSLRATEGSEAISSRIDSGDLTGLTSKEPWSKSTYFEEYKKSFAQGEYNLKEQVSGITGPVIRSYFSGGIIPIAAPTGSYTAGSTIVDDFLKKRKEMVPLAESSSPPSAASPVVSPSGSSSRERKGLTLDELMNDLEKELPTYSGLDIDVNILSVNIVSKRTQKQPPLLFKVEDYGYAISEIISKLDQMFRQYPDMRFTRRFSSSKGGDTLVLDIQDTANSPAASPDSTSSPVEVKEKILRSTDDGFEVAWDDIVEVSVLPRRTNPDRRELVIKVGEQFNFVFNFTQTPLNDYYVYVETGTPSLLLGIKDWEGFLDTFATGVDKSRGRIEIKVGESVMSILEQLKKNNPGFPFPRMALGGNIFKELEFVTEFSSVAENPAVASSSPATVEEIDRQIGELKSQITAGQSAIERIGAGTGRIQKQIDYLRKTWKNDNPSKRDLLSLDKLITTRNANNKEISRIGKHINKMNAELRLLKEERTKKSEEASANAGSPPSTSSPVVIADLLHLSPGETITIAQSNHVFVEAVHPNTYPGSRVLNIQGRKGYKPFHIQLEFRPNQLYGDSGFSYRRLDDGRQYVIIHVPFWEEFLKYFSAKVDENTGLIEIGVRYQDMLILRQVEARNPELSLLEIPLGGDGQEFKTFRLGTGFFALHFWEKSVVVDIDELKPFDESFTMTDTLNIGGKFMPVTLEMGQYKLNKQNYLIFKIDGLPVYYAYLGNNLIASQFDFIKYIMRDLSKAGQAWSATKLLTEIRQGLSRSQYKAPGQELSSSIALHPIINNRIRIRGENQSAASSPPQGSSPVMVLHAESKSKLSGLTFSVSNIDWLWNSVDDDLRMAALKFREEANNMYVTRERNGTFSVKRFPCSDYYGKALLLDLENIKAGITATGELYIHIFHRLAGKMRRVIARIEVNVEAAGALPASTSSHKIVSYEELPARLLEMIGEVRGNAYIGNKESFLVSIDGKKHEFNKRTDALQARTAILQAINKLPDAANLRLGLTIDKTNKNELVITTIVKSPDAPAGNDTSAIPAMAQQASSALTTGERVGGIDFRVITTITQPMGNLSGLTFSLPPLSSLKDINLSDELGQIQKMLQAGIIPSGERLKEYVAACYQRGELKEHLEGIVGCLVDMCRLEEENALEASNELKEVLLIIDAV